MPATHARNVALTPLLSDYVDELVASGEYSNASEVLRDGLRALKQRRDIHIAELAEIRSRIATGLKQLDNGEGVRGPSSDILNNLMGQVKQDRQDLV